MNKTGIKLLSAVLSLVLLLGLLPAAALAAGSADHTHAGWTKWTATDALPATAGNYVLSGNVLLAQSWLAPKGETKLCLEGHSVILSAGSGCVIQVPETATLELYDLDANDGLITGGKGNDNSADYLGGGVSVKGSFIMYGGKITGNTASTGGGVYVSDSAQFYMNGGIITGNTAAVSGGGVTVRNKFYVSGSATVTGNTRSGAANNVYLDSGKVISVAGALTGAFGVTSRSEPTSGKPVPLTSALKGKGTTANFTSDTGKFSIGTNTAGEAVLQLIDPATFRFPGWSSATAMPTKAGDYSLYDNVTLSQTWIVPEGTTRLCLEGRTLRLSGSEGSVIEVPAGAVLELYDREGNSGTITGGKGKSSSGYTTGGGIFVQGNLAMYGGSITGNTAANGGGVYLDTDGIFRLNGGSITKNTATVSGGGVFTRGTFAVSGTPTVTGNTMGGGADNVRLTAGKRITVTAAFSGAVGVNCATAPTAEAPQVLTSGLLGRGAYNSFTSDNGNYSVDSNADGEAILTAVKSATPSTDPTPAPDPKPSGQMKYNAWSAADAMPTAAGDYSLSGNVTLKETWTVPQGTTRLSLEGHSLALNAEGGSVIYVPAGAALELYDAGGSTGVITGGKGRAGTGFYLGGGVFVAGSFTMNGGQISGNAATSGGGIYVDTSGKCTLAGGKITGNTATVGGGGMFVRGSLTVSGGASVTGNSKGSDADNLRLANDKTIAVAGKLTGSFGINTAAVPTALAPTAITAGLSGKGDAANFASDDKSFAVGLNAAGEAVLSLAPAAEEKITFTEWKTANALPGAAGDFLLTSDVLLKETWTAPKGRVRLNLNGHSIALSANGGSVMQIPSDAVVELYDLENNSGVITRGKGRADSGYYLGGGVYVQGTLNQYGGRIMGNSATSGGGVYVDLTGTYRLLGGKVTGNTVTGYGGGVFARGSMEAAGDVSVSGNTKKDGSADNLRLAANENLLITGPISGSIGVNKAVAPEEGSPVTVTVGLSGNGGAAVFSSDDGRFTIILNDKGEVLLSVYCPKDKTCPISAYTDMKATDWYHDGVHFVLESGFMSGYGNKTFGPGDSTTRAMAATIIWNMAGKPKAVGKLTFTDVKDGKWYTEAIRWAAGAGVITGYTDGITGELIFRPDDNVTREQLSAMMYRFAQYQKVDVSVGEDTNILSYDDAFSIGAWAVPAMQWAAGSGLMGGRTASTMDPKANATRAEVATVVMRYSTKVAK